MSKSVAFGTGAWGRRAARTVPIATAVLAMTVPLLLMAQPTRAASLINRDTRDHKVAIVDGAQGESRVVKPGESWSGFCQEGCNLRLNDNPGDEYKLEGGDKVAIQDGFVYYDSGDGSAPAEAAPPVKVPPPAR